MIKDIIFAGIYSDKYALHYARIRQQMLDNGVDEKNILFKNVPQSTFDTQNIETRYTCKHCFKKHGKDWLKKRPQGCGFIFHAGEDCKIKHQLEIYKRFVNTNILIIYLDCDITIDNEFKNIKYEAMLGDNVFVFENERNKKRWVSSVNIGFTLCRPTKQVIHFYEDILKTIHKNVYPLNWDQVAVNEKLKKENIKFTTTKDTGFIHTRSGCNPIYKK